MEPPTAEAVFWNHVGSVSWATGANVAILTELFSQIPLPSQNFIKIIDTLKLSVCSDRKLESVLK